MQTFDPVKSDYVYLDKDKVQEYLDKGILRGQPFGDVWVASYNEIAMRRDKVEWDETLLTVRGLRFVKGRSGYFISNPCMKKSFNVGERPETKLENLPQEPFTVTEKIDGSMLTSGFDYSGYFHHTTKASWDNDYTRAAYKFLPTMEEEDLWVTLISEIIIENDPMRRVTDRAPGLYVITAFHSMTGEEYGRPFVENIARKYNLKVVPEVQCNDLNELWRLMDTAKDTEGWVVKFQSGLRVKFKTSWYKAINYMLSDLNTPEKSRETVKEYLVLNQGSLDWIESWPKELREEVGAIATSIQDEHVKAIGEITSVVCSDEDLSHKEFALKHKDHPLFHHMMGARRGHSNWKDKLWKII